MKPMHLNAEVGLLLNGELKLNNSVVAWSEIGEGSRSLFCLTNNMNCCETTLNLGDWIDPNNDTVSQSQSTSDIYQGYRNNSILLQHPHQGMTPFLQGIFHCDVIDGNDQMQRLYIGIYIQLENGKKGITVIFHACDGYFTFLRSSFK